MTAPADGGPVRLEDLRVGPVLAEGGEGRVHLLPRQPHLLYKAYLRPAPRDHLDALTAWPSSLGSGADRSRVRAGSAWPQAVVSYGGRAVGLLVPRAPRRFSVRHRDGHSRLASLSYLTADPGHRAAAYGLELPRPAGPERVGLVYALARLLDVFASAPEPVGHGDLSTKNVLWSLQRGPEVFVIDCDNAEIFARPVPGGGAPDGGGPEGAGLERTGSRRRAMTPNWDDPAVERGANPTLESDRYSLALIFLRVVGAANFPIQARQRAGGPVSVEFPVPAGAWSRALLDPDAPVWDLVARSLSVEQPASRPPASAWVTVLEGLLADMGAGAVAESVRQAQDGEEASGPRSDRRPTPGRVRPGGDPTPGADPGDVTVKPVAAPERAARSWSKVSPVPRYGAAPAGATPGPAPGPGAGGFVWRPVGPATPAPWSASSVPPVAPGAGGVGPGGGVTAPSAGRVVSGVAVWPEIRALLVRFARWWARIHLAMARALVTAGRRRAGLRSLAFCVVVDLALAVVVGIFGAMITAPLLGV